VSEQASFTLRRRNPDVLTCIANLSNDEVFTPPEFANRMLDTLTEAWAANHQGANLWADPKATFLDPCTKSGVFLREITRRLTEGLAARMPNLDQRVNHILTKQVFGIGITQITSLLARRSVYCSRHADGKHSIAKAFGNDSGNIWFQRMEHTWEAEKCRYCGAGKSVFERGVGLETHAYAFIHTDNIKARLAELFGRKMQFDVIIGNPPYQLASDGGTRDVPIYQLFVAQAKKLQPRFLAMVIPSRWMSGGLGLSEFRETMLSDRRIRFLADYPVAKEVFSSVEVKGGICYFLWDNSWSADCNVTVVRGKTVFGPIGRKLDAYDIFIRDARAIPILQKVLDKSEPSLSEITSARTAFGLYSNYSAYREKPQKGDVRFYGTSARGRFTGWVSPTVVTTNQDAIDTYKALIPKASSDGGQKLPDVVLGKPWVAESPSICTQSFLFVATKTLKEAESVASYYRTRFVRFLVSLRKIAQDTTAASYLWCPQQTWDRTWTDEELFAKYSITPEEQAYIASQVRPMNLEAAADE